MLRNKKKEATEHRAVLVLRGAQLSDRISDTDPKKENLPVKESVALDHSKEAERTAEILNQVLKKVHEILKEHPINKERERSGLLPANGILTRGAGQMPQIEKITKKLGFKACCIASESTVLGVASLAGFDIRTDQSFTGNIDTDIYGKATLAAEALKNNDLVVLHFKATDLMGHDNNPTGKVAAIEKYDQMIGICLEEIKKITSDNVIVALAADHSTPCERREHSGDPVPVLINGKNIRHDAVKHYDEISCSQGGLGRIKGSDFINILLDYLEVVVKQGN